MPRIMKVSMLNHFCLCFIFFTLFSLDDGFSCHYLGDRLRNYGSVVVCVDDDLYLSVAM